MSNPTLLLLCMIALAVAFGCSAGETRADDRSHAWSDPATRAEAWNSPERDAWQRPEQIVAALGLPRGATVADIGAGTGYMVKHLSAAVGASGRVLALDASPEMVDYLRRNGPELGPARIEAREVRHDDPALHPASIDGALVLDVWHHMHGREAYAASVYRGLRTGGRLVVVDHDVDAETGPPPSMRVAPERVKEELESAGFEVEIAPEAMPRHYMVVGRKE